MATRTDNTMVEWLQKINKDIAEAKTLADADMPFLVQLETLVLQRLKQPVDDLRAQGTLPPAQGQGMPPGMIPGGMPPMGGGIPGVAGNAPMPNPDELRRMLTQGEGLMV